MAGKISQVDCPGNLWATASDGAWGGCGADDIPDNECSDLPAALPEADIQIAGLYGDNEPFNQVYTPVGTFAVDGRTYYRGVEDPSMYFYNTVGCGDVEGAIWVLSAVVPDDDVVDQNRQTGSTQGCDNEFNLNSCDTCTAPLGDFDHGWQWFGDHGVSQFDQPVTISAVDGGSLDCEMSACREHSPGQQDDDCCGNPNEVWCADGYSLSFVNLASVPGFYPQCGGSSTPIPGPQDGSTKIGNTCCTPQWSNSHDSTAATCTIGATTVDCENLGVIDATGGDTSIFGDISDAPSRDLSDYIRGMSPVPACAACGGDANPSVLSNQFKVYQFTVETEFTFQASLCSDHTDYDANMALLLEGGPLIVPSQFTSYLDRIFSYLLQ